MADRRPPPVVDLEVMRRAGERTRAETWGHPSITRRAVAPIDRDPARGGQSRPPQPPLTVAAFAMPTRIAKSSPCCALEPGVGGDG